MELAALALIRAAGVLEMKGSRRLLSGLAFGCAAGCAALLDELTGKIAKEGAAALAKLRGLDAEIAVLDRVQLSSKVD